MLLVFCVGVAVGLVVLLVYFSVNECVSYYICCELIWVFVWIGVFGIVGVAWMCGCWVGFGLDGYGLSILGCL